MKTLLVLPVLIFAALVGHAQDTLTKRNGETLVIRLTEVNPQDIHYRLFSYQEGPVFTLPKEEIKLLKYANGYRENYESYAPPLKLVYDNSDLSLQMVRRYFYYRGFRIQEADMLGLASKLGDQKLNRLVKRATEIRLFQNITGVVALGFFATGAYIYRNNRTPRGRFGRPLNTASITKAHKNANALLICGAVSSVLSVSFMIERRRHDRFIVNAYNEIIWKH